MKISKFCRIALFLLIIYAFYQLIQLCTVFFLVRIKVSALMISQSRRSHLSCKAEVFIRLITSNSMPFLAFLINRSSFIALYGLTLIVVLLKLSSTIPMTSIYSPTVAIWLWESDSRLYHLLLAKPGETYLSNEERRVLLSLDSRLCCVYNVWGCLFSIEKSIPWWGWPMLIGILYSF